MQHVRATQLRRAFEALGELARVSDLAEYQTRTAQLLRYVIPCDIASYNAVDPRTHRATVAADPGDTLFDGGADVFACYAQQNPLVAHYARTRESRALCISDFLTRRQLQSTELYDYVYREIGVRYQLALTLPSPLRPAEMIGLTLSRGRRDFSLAERELLDLMGPHLRATLDRLTEATLARAMLAAPRMMTAGSCSSPRRGPWCAPRRRRSVRSGWPPGSPCRRRCGRGSSGSGGPAR